MLLQETEQQQDQPDGARESVREQRRDGREGSPHQLRPQHPLRGGAGAGENPPAETRRATPGAASLEPGAGQGQRGRGGGLGSPESGGHPPHHSSRDHQTPGLITESITGGS